MNKFYLFLVIASLSFMISGCSKDDDPGNNEQRITTDEIYYANKFAGDVLSEIYLWNKEINKDISKLNPDLNEDPIQTVHDIRYKANGKEIDKWSMLTDDVSELVSGMQGVTTTFGYDLMLGKFSNSDTYYAVITFVYANSPARQAGIRRGDIVMQIDRKDITTANYMNLFYSSGIELGMAVKDGNTIKPTGENKKLTAVRMYEDPILATNVFDCGNKKVGYLAYSGFDVVSVTKLIEICKDFKQQGVSELILDLRYNGGGYVFTELALASMLAPEQAVNNKELYETEIWNADYMAYYKSKGVDLNTYFDTKHSITIDGVTTTVDTKNTNIGIKKIYGLISSGTASASESVLIGLMPYVDIELIGANSHGKYCTGSVLQPKDLYQDKNGNDTSPKAIKNWGIYVMFNRYADKNGENPCMPDGLIPDIEVRDNPFDGYQLGDERETLLNKALARAGKTDLLPQTRSISMPLHQLKAVQTSPLFGKRIDNRLIDKIKR